MQLQTKIESNKHKPPGYEALHADQTTDNAMEIDQNIDNLLNQQHDKTDQGSDQFNFKYKEQPASEKEQEANNQKKVVHIEMQASSGEATPKPQGSSPGDNNLATSRSLEMEIEEIQELVRIEKQEEIQNEFLDRFKEGGSS